MSRNLPMAGYSLVVNDIRPGPVADLKDAGAISAASCSDAAARSEIIITMLKVSLSLTSLVQQMLMALMNEGKGHLDRSAIVQFIERMAGVELTKDTASQA